ncbi:MAG TPA: type II secretion system protein GspE, partial [Rhabdochlamydiaceae bacterium]
SERELKELGLNEKVLYKGNGCAHCYGLGYRGRHGIYELMNLTSPIKRQLLKSADALELQKVAFSCGMSGLREEGAYLVKDGITTSAEVLRVTRGCEDI